jgi:hypothetical protein
VAIFTRFFLPNIRSEPVTCLSLVGAWSLFLLSISRYTHCCLPWCMGLRGRGDNYCTIIISRLMPVERRREVQWVGGGSVPTRWYTLPTTHLTRQNETLLLPSHCLVVTRGVGGNDTRARGDMWVFAAQGKWIMTGAGHPTLVRDFTVIELPCSSLQNETDCFKPSLPSPH